MPIIRMSWEMDEVGCDQNACTYYKDCVLSEIFKNGVDGHDSVKATWHSVSNHRPTLGVKVTGPQTFECVCADEDVPIDREDLVEAVGELVDAALESREQYEPREEEDGGQA